MPPSSPTVASWELVLRLRERREQMGIEVKEITEFLGFSRNYWSAVENERKLLSEESLTRLLELLEFDQDERDELSELRETAKQRGWWTRQPSLFGVDLQRLFGLEYGADSIRGYESLLIPGLLQTPDYARSMMTPSIILRKVEVDQRVEARMKRQERLTGPEPLKLTAVISEAALRQQIGGTTVLRNQLDHLIRMVEDHADTVEVLIIPFTAVWCGLFGAATLHLIDFAKAALPTVVWHESVTSGGIIDDTAKVRDLAMSFEEGRSRTLSREDSLRLITQSKKELG